MPSARCLRTPAAALVVAAVTAGCGNGARTVGAGEAPATRPGIDPSVERVLRRPTVARMLRRCGVTRPNRSIPPGQGRNPGPDVTDYHGNGRLWTVLPPRGVLVAGPGDVQGDGSISRKFPWWRRAQGDLKITVRRLDARAGRLRARVPIGYGPTGFQSSAVIFSGEGCWRVTGMAGNARLSFVTLVVRARPQ